MTAVASRLSLSQLCALSPLASALASISFHDVLVVARVSHGHLHVMLELQSPLRFTVRLFVVRQLRVRQDDVAGNGRAEAGEGIGLGEPGVARTRS